LDSGTKVQPTKLSREFNIDRTYISKIIKHEFPNLESLGRKDAALLTQKNLKTKRHCHHWLRYSDIQRERIGLSKAQLLTVEQMKKLWKK